ncbi:MAG: fatty acid desaturase [Pseudomonadota bacterium]
MAPTDIDRKANRSTAGVQQSKLVQQEILAVGDAWRARHPWIAAHTDAIGFTVFLVSCLAIVGTATAYGAGLLPAWATVLVAAFFMSLLHELEHDLIHFMYFRKNAFLHNLMMAGVWLFRPSTISPWVRRRLHLHHHKFSGTESDLEERGITNGVPWGLKRLLMVGDHMLAVYLRPLETRRMIKAFVAAQKNATPAEKRAIVRENLFGYFPLGIAHYALWHGLVAYYAVTWTAAALGQPPALPAMLAPHAGLLQTLLDGANFLAVTILLPNVLRVFCLHFVSSNMHYYGDVEPGNVIQQTQVWNAWWLAPLHLFCFNFGATHAIHHFVVRDPFYLRQLTAAEAYPILKKYGVRFNDYGTFRRANRWALAPASQQTAAAPATH